MRAVLALIVAVFVTPLAVAAADTVEKPAALVADGIPPVAAELAARTRPYMEFRIAAFLGWHPKDRSLLVATRFANTNQVHRVARPGGAREQLTFEEDRILDASHAPLSGDVTVVQKDVGGNEFYQLYTLAAGRLTLLTDGKSRNVFGAWSDDGELIGYTSTRRNGTDADVYLMDPRDRTTDRRVAQVEGSWEFADFAPDRKRAVLIERISITKSNLWLLDLATNALTPIGDHRKTVAYEVARYAPDGSLWVTADVDADFLRLGTIDPRTGRFTPKAPEPKWDVETFDIAKDGSFVAYTVNEAGRSVLRLLDVTAGTARTAPLPAGIVGDLQVAPWGEIGLTFTSARSPSDAFSVDPQTMAVVRWTTSETGGLDPDDNAEPETIEVKSSDGLTISGFLYGGPESQSRPGFLGRNNYLINELGIAIFFPNVRGSSGYGKRFVSLDNGPFRREDSVRDVGVFLDALAKDPLLDANRFAVTGGSYGGYMCYATSIFYGGRLKGASCVVAISSFVTFLENTQSYRRDLRRVEYGDERDPKQRRKLLEISPLTRVQEIRLPMLVVTGANDPRVPASEADQIVAAIRANGGSAWHLLGQDEGHGFAKKANQDYQFWTSLMFWEQTLLAPHRE
jgi:dipeptidyl aminopeptidase/acylaminoacyl peptidase